MNTRRFSYHLLIFLCSFFIITLFNFRFFSLLANLLPPYQVFCTAIFMITCLSLLFEVLCIKQICKLIVIIVLLFSALISFFIDSLQVGITPDIIQSFFNTNASEMRRFLGFDFLKHMLIFGILPSLLIVLIPLRTPSFFKDLIIKLCMILFYASLAFVLWSFILGKNLVYLLTTQHHLQHIIVPISPIRSTVLFHAQKQTPTFKYQQVALDAKIQHTPKSKILILVIGESLRGTQLHNYSRNLLPLTQSHSNLINFSNFKSCGVITAISVPCMLTHYTHDTYTNRHLSKFTDNILDIAQRVGIKTYWLDSNSGSAQNCIGEVCKRTKEVYYFDDLDGAVVDKFLNISHHLDLKSNYFFVLHTFGSHGPDYFKRYPKKFEVYKPICKSKNPNLCTKDELINAYDNSILYTDFLIHTLISRLEILQKNFDTSLLYVSDHGESLGEFGNYMHGGFSYALAPKHQTQVGALAWFGSNFEEKYNHYRAKEALSLSQDFIFHTVLGFFNIKTSVYNKTLDLGNNP